MVKVRNTNNLHIYKSWDAAHSTGHTHTHTHTFWQECRNSYIPHTDFHSHYDSTVLRRTTRDTQKLCGHKSTMHPGKKSLVIHENKEALLSNWITCVTELDGGERSASWPQPLYNQGNSHWYPLNRRLGSPTGSLDIFWKIHKSVAPPRIPIPDHLALNVLTMARANYFLTPKVSWIRREFLLVIVPRMWSLVVGYLTTPFHIPENGNNHTHYHENLKSWPV